MTACAYSQPGLARSWAPVLLRSPVTAMARPLETRVAGRVHVNQVARAGPLVAVGRLALRTLLPRTAMALERLRNRRVRMPELACEQARTPAGASSGCADPLLLGQRERARAAERTTRAIVQTSQRFALDRSRLAPAPRP